MGPEAGKLFYEIVIGKTKAAKDQDHINTILYGHATMPDRTAAIFNGDDTPKKLLLEDCKTLEAMGCKAICVTCNTAHYFVHQFEDELGIPVISLIREAAKEMGRKFPGGKVAVLATTGTIRTELYQDALKAQGVIPYVPSEVAQEKVMHTIYDCVKAGKPAEAEVFEYIDRELKAEGCNAALLACTELPIAKRQLGLEDFYMDPMEIMAERAIEFMGKELK